MSRRGRAPFLVPLNLGNDRLAEKRTRKAGETHLAALELRPGDLEATSNRSWAAIDPHPAVQDVCLQLRAKEARE